MKLHRRKKMAITVPTTSMGDIAFLLIIFFMVCSNFAKENRIKYKSPDALDVDKVKNTKISIVVDEKSEIYYNGKLMDSARTVETMVDAYVRETTTDEERMVMFKCDHLVEKRVFEPVLEAITRAGGIIVAVGEKRKTD